MLLDLGTRHTPSHPRSRGRHRGFGFGAAARPRPAAPSPELLPYRALASENPAASPGAAGNGVRPQRPLGHTSVPEQEEAPCTLR